MAVFQPYAEKGAAGERLRNGASRDFASVCGGH
jgi:hypothetical protein